MIQEVMKLHNLLSLPHLLARHTRGEKPIIDYFSHNVVIFVEYLNILKKKKDKVVIEEIRKEKGKE